MRYRGPDLYRRPPKRNRPLSLPLLHLIPFRQEIEQVVLPNVHLPARPLAVAP